MSCRRMTELISQSMERPLTRGERVALRLHTLTCTPCRRFHRQLRALGRAIREGLSADEAREAMRTAASSTALSAEQRDRVRRALEGRPASDPPPGG